MTKIILIDTLFFCFLILLLKSFPHRECFLKTVIYFTICLKEKSELFDYRKSNELNIICPNCPYHLPRINLM